MGGAQAIAALAYGTETIRRVDVIVGPGNLYVQEAKRQVCGRRRHRRLRRARATCCVIARRRAPTRARRPPTCCAQAEHGAGTLVVRGQRRRRAARRVAAARRAAGAWRRSSTRADLDAALAFAEAFAPEHLQLMGAAAEALAPRVRSAGCLFVGARARHRVRRLRRGLQPHAARPAGAARFASGLDVAPLPPPHGRGPDPAAAAARAAPRPGAAIARAEGFDAPRRVDGGKTGESQRR